MLLASCPASPEISALAEAHGVVSTRFKIHDPDQTCMICGQCQELCDCGGIGIEKSTGGLPRIVDPMLCTGGTCAAACPYGALVLQNNSTDQKEARIGALSRQMEPDEVVAMACVWGGLSAADNALIAALGPIPKTQANLDNLASIYQLCKYNTRIRTLLSVALRRPWEKTYRGDQRHALEFDRDFTAAIEEEFDFAESALNEPAFYRYA